MTSALSQNANDLALSAMGAKGGVLLTDATAITGNFRIMQVLTDATFTVLTTDMTKNGTAVIATGSDFGTLPQGSVIYGKITAVTLATGKVILYK